MEGRTESRRPSEDEAGRVTAGFVVLAQRRPSAPVRLNRFLAASGVASRRHCDELIVAGRVMINGRVCTDFSVQPSAEDYVKVDGKLVRGEKRLHLLLHKPAGFVSTRRDSHARDTVFDLLPAKFPRLFNIGRLDAQSEGLLLLTNDGELAQRLTHPSYQVEKEYEATIDKPWDPTVAEKLQGGIYLDGQRARIDLIRPLSPLRLRIVLRQGLNRQIRRMLFAVGYEVERLVRTRVANLRLGSLPRGHWRPLTSAELKTLQRERPRPPLVSVRSQNSKQRRAANAATRRNSNHDRQPAD